MKFPIIPCDLCGSQPTLQRKQVKQMLREWEKRHPGRVDSMFRALSNLVPSHLMDRALFSFASVVPTGVGTETAFDPIAAGTFASVTGSAPTPAARPPVAAPTATAATSQLPVDGTSRTTAYVPGRGLLGEWSPVCAYAVKGCHVAWKGPVAGLVWSLAIHTCGDPAVTSPPAIAE